MTPNTLKHETRVKRVINFEPNGICFNIDFSSLLLNPSTGRLWLYLAQVELTCFGSRFWHTAHPFSLLSLLVFLTEWVVVLKQWTTFNSLNSD